VADVAEQRIVLLGPPGSGKGTQAELLAQALGVPAISTGDMLREAVAAGSELGHKVEGIMAAGELVGDDLMAEIVRARLSQEDAAAGFLLDGYPRTLPQIQTLDEVLEAAEVNLDHVLFIDAPEEVLVARALGRQRADDQEDVVRERLRVYAQKTQPLVGEYERRGLLRSISGDNEIENVQSSILEALAPATIASSEEGLA
jgi:adenylate kinase